MIIRSEKGSSLITVLLGLVLVLALVGGGWYVWQSRAENSESSPQNATTQENSTPKTIKSGTFAGVSPKTGSGSVKLIKNVDGSYTIELGEDFVVQNGPALFVGF